MTPENLIWRRSNLNLTGVKNENNDHDLNPLRMCLKNCAIANCVKDAIAICNKYYNMQFLDIFFLQQNVMIYNSQSFFRYSLFHLRSPTRRNYVLHENTDDSCYLIYCTIHVRWLCEYHEIPWVLPQKLILTSSAAVGNAITFWRYYLRYCLIWS